MARYQKRSPAAENLQQKIFPNDRDPFGKYDGDLTTAKKLLPAIVAYTGFPGTPLYDFRMAEIAQYLHELDDRRESHRTNFLLEVIKRWETAYVGTENSPWCSYHKGAPRKSKDTARNLQEGVAFLAYLWNQQGSRKAAATT